MTFLRNVLPNVLLQGQNAVLVVKKMPQNFYQCRLPTPSPPSSTGPVWSGCDTLEICTSGLAKLNHFFPLKSQTEEFAANWYFLMGGPLPSCTRYLASCLLLIYRKSHWICVSPQNLWAKSSSKSLIVCLLQGYDFRQLPDQSNRYLQSSPKS